jgi:hypothetical protein
MPRWRSVARYEACGCSSGDYTNPVKVVVNLEEKIGKWVGRKDAGDDPFAAYARLLRISKGLVSTTPYPRGVFRFKTHEEADEWKWKHILKAAKRG